MQEFALGILIYIKDVLLSTLIQLFVLFGPLAILSLLMNFISEKNRLYGIRIFGIRGYLYGFSWLGTSIHEIGHAIFAVVFGHKIQKIDLFKPDLKTGTLGQVRHSYNPKNPYHLVGNLFIGIGPILLGCGLLFLITYLIYGFNLSRLSGTPITHETFQSVESLKLLWGSISEAGPLYWWVVMQSDAAAWWKLIIYIYCLYAIGSAMALSKPDVAGAASGLKYFALLLLLFNGATLWIGDFAVAGFKTASIYFSGFYFIILASTAVNLVFLGVLWIISQFWRLR